VPNRDLAALSLPLSEIKAGLFKALAHPARIRILEVLSQDECSVSELQPLVAIEPSHLSQQLAVLRRANLVTSRRAGASVIYALSDPQTRLLLTVSKRMLINSLAVGENILADLRSATAE
jgi:ArsR family transcriptional regulator